MDITKLFTLIEEGKESEPIFLTSSSEAARSLNSLGFNTMAVKDKEEQKYLLQAIMCEKIKQPIAIAFNNTKKECTRAEELKNEIASYMGCCRVTVANHIYGVSAMATQAVKNNPEELIKLATKSKEYLEAAISDESKKEITEYLNSFVRAHITAFRNGIKDRVNTKKIKTGFELLDDELGGGLYEGLYFLGACSSLGKTTFILQIADQITKSGHDVLLFALEMAESELMAKSFSRLTYKNVKSSHLPIKYAKTPRGITDVERYDKYCPAELNIIESSIDEYEKYPGNLRIAEGVGNIGIEQIKEDVKKHILITGNIPVVIIDYMQILAPYNERATDKQNTDKAVIELKRLSRDYKLTVIGISSFNRESYNKPLTMSAFKESGSIEYSADVLLGLQYNFTDRDTKAKITLEEAMAQNPRNIELCILKNRNGKTGGKISFDYYPKFNYYEEIESNCYDD